MAKSGFWSQLWTFDKNKMEPWVAFRAALGMALSVGLGYMLGSTTIGLSIAIGALNVCYSDKSDAYRERAKRMVTAAVLSALAVFAAALSANEPVLMFVLLTIGAFFAGMLVVVDSVAADLGVIGLATFLIFSAQALNPVQALELSVYAFAGGILQSVISIGLWPLRRYKPERRALSSLYQDLAFLAVSQKYTKDETPMGSLQSIETQNALTALAEDERLEARRYRSLLSQGERLRITILSMLRLRKRLQREGVGHPSVVLVNDTLEAASTILRAVSVVIVSGEPLGVAQKYVTQIESLTAQLRTRRSETESPFFAAVLNDLTFQMEALGGQIRAVCELALKTTQAGIEKAERLEASRPIRMRFWGSLATLRANMTLQSPGFRHAIRLSLCIAIGEIISRIFHPHLHRAYWVPMTIAIVLKPDYASTFSRSFLRMAGTLVGLVLATALFHILPEAPWVEISLIVIFTFMTRWAGSANYGIFAMCVGALVVLLIAITGVAPKDVIWARGINTLIGGAIALVVYWCWPTSEKLQMSEVIARMLDTYLAYFRAIGQTVQGQGASAQEMDRLRQKARVARANFHAAAERFIMERSASFEDKKVISAVMVASNRFAHSMMAVEAGATQPISEKQRDAFIAFAGNVDRTVGLLSEALRGRDISHNQFPDVRAGYVQFSESRQSDSEQFALLFEETDRMTNSLVTLTEQIMKRLFTSRIRKS